MRFRLLPTDDKFFDLFDAAAANVAECAAACASCSTAGARRRRHDRRGHRLRAARRRAHPDILQRLNTSFVTPFDREDIHALAEELDDVVDDMLEVAYRLELARPATRRPCPS